MYETQAYGSTDVRQEDVHEEECVFDGEGIEVPAPPEWDDLPPFPDPAAPAEGAQADEGTGEGGEPRKGVREMTPRELGMRGEELAAKYLYDRWGWSILARNWKGRFGEVDIVALDELDNTDTVVLVEVKTRRAPRDDGEVMPEEAVNDRKRRRYCLMAMDYCCQHPETNSVRFDVVALTVDDSQTAHLHYIPNAYSWDNRL